MTKTVLIVTPGMEAWGNFKKLCKAKGWSYQTLANNKRTPAINRPIEVDGEKVYRVEVR